MLRLQTANIHSWVCTTSVRVDLSVMVVSGNQLWLTEQQPDPHADAVKTFLLMRGKAGLKGRAVKQLVIGS